jgi:hypothetical protein
MKKKIINGILMSALLLAGTTSFVSCKDNVDDVETGIRTDMQTMKSELETQLGQLEQRVGILEQNQVSVDQLNQAINDLRNEINNTLTTELAKKADLSYVKKQVKALQAQIDLLAEKIAELSKTMVTGVVLQETLDCVVGTINLPGFKPAFLAAYVGENKTGVPELPISGPDYNVDPDGNYLKASELPTDEDMFVGNSGKNSYLINGTGNAGTLYFTINPRKVDPTLLQFDLINSTGEESPIKLSNVQKSDHLITFAISKHGNGMTRADGDVLVSPTGTSVENDKTYLYEAKATVNLDGIEKIHFDWTKFGYNNQWDAGAGLLGINQGPDAEAQNLFGRFQYLAKQIKAKNIQNTFEASLKILQDFYNGVYQQREKLQKQALRVSWDDGGNDVISGFDITTVTINPLNYKQMILADQLLSGAQWNATTLNGLVTKLVGKITSKLPNINVPAGGFSFAIPTVSGEGVAGYPEFVVTNVTGNQKFIYDTTLGWRDVTAGLPGTPIADPVFADATVDELLNKIIAQINKQMDNSKPTATSLHQLNDMINSILKPYNALKSKTGAGVMTRVNNYLNAVSQKILDAFDYAPCWKLTEPTLLFESREGINRMYPFSDADGSMHFNAGEYTFIMTSLTEEMIVPVYRKYIALIYGGKVKFAQSFAGNEKIVQIEIPNEACEIVYQTCDYYGNVVTKRYPINR